MLSPTLHEWTFECSADPDLIPGVYRALFAASDINLNRFGWRFDMRVGAGD